MARVLVVDDTAPVREMCAWILRRRGHEVIEADGGAAAAQLYASEHPDAVLLDVMMPGVDGLTALAEIRTLDPDARVAMLTGARDEATLRRAVALGARDYLAKPIEVSRLVQAVERLVGMLVVQAADPMLAMLVVEAS
ncbi:MAG TPA: response regulator [Chloroflexota bacterium]